MAKSSNTGMTVLLLGLLGGGVALAWWYFSQNGATVPAVPTTGGPSAFWSRLSLLSGGMTGTVIYPDGSTSSLANMTTGADANGNVYVQGPGGHVYELGSSDGMGDFPATLVV